LTPRLDELLGPRRVWPPEQPLADGVTYRELWSPASLDPRAKPGIYRALEEDASRAFGADLSNYWHDREVEGFLDGIARFVMLFDYDQVLVGWTSYWLMEQCGGRVCLYVDSTVVAPEYQSRGLMRRLFPILLTSEPALWAPGGYVTARTESPIFHRLFAGLFGEERVHPRPGAQPPPDAVACAAELAEHLGQRSNFDPPTLRVLGAYANVEALYGELPSCGDPRLDRFYREQLGPLDAFLLVADPARYRTPTITAQTPTH
jgi:GNAT superfamily N-acetyltransferase